MLVVVDILWYILVELHVIEYLGSGVNIESVYGLVLPGNKP